MVSRSTLPQSKSWMKTPRWVSERWRTSPGRDCWTSPHAPSAGAVSHSARPGTPTSAPHVQPADPAQASLPDSTRTEAARPLVGPIEVTDGVAGVIDPDVLWSCTTCGACVQQCPVDLENVYH